MKDLGNTNYVLGIQILRDRKNRVLALSQATYIDKVLTHFSMQNSKKGLMPTRHGIVLSKKQCPSTPQEKRGYETRVIRVNSWKSDIGDVVHQNRYLLRSRSCE